MGTQGQPDVSQAPFCGTLMWVVFLFLLPWQALPVFQGWLPSRILDYLMSLVSSHMLSLWVPLIPSSTGVTLNRSTLQLFSLHSFILSLLFCFSHQRPRKGIASEGLCPCCVGRWALPSSQDCFSQLNLSGVSRCPWPCCATDDVPSCACDHVCCLTLQNSWAVRAALRIIWKHCSSVLCSVENGRIVHL